MNATDWRSIHDRLSRLDSESLVNVALGAAAAVLPVWEASAPSVVRERPIEAITAIRAWARTRVVPSDIKKLATEAYGAVGSSGLPPGDVRLAGLAAAHAAFALYFWAQGDRERVLTAARDAIGNALNASSESHLASDLQGKTATGDPDTDGGAAQPGIAADGAVPRR
jgi:hypothetical protein